MSSGIEAALTFTGLAVMLWVSTRQAERSQRFDNVDEVNINIMQTRQDMRLACHLLMYIGLLLNLMFAFLVYKLH